MARNIGFLAFRQLFDRTSCTYTYLLADPETKEAVLIDPVDTLVDRDLRVISECGFKLVYALNTHAHADHISGTGLIKRAIPSVKSVLGKASSGKADVLVCQDDSIKFGSNVSLKVIETPGHTAGCVSYYLANPDENAVGVVFTGDALLIRGCGRTDFQEGDSDSLFSSVREKLFKLPPNTFVYPAHDYRGITCSTIAEEIRFNPRLGEQKTLQEFRDIMTNLQLPRPKMIDVAVPANLNCGIFPED
ncbi:Metallo-beta-lactamase [Gracilaria domingensis]|nr:Metallo-beta-lactamase [Gracilaria domingensis]